MNLIINSKSLPVICHQVIYLLSFDLESYPRSIDTTSRTVGSSGRDRRTNGEWQPCEHVAVLEDSINDVSTEMDPEDVMYTG